MFNLNFNCTTIPNVMRCARKILKGDPKKTFDAYKTDKERVELEKMSRYYLELLAQGKLLQWLKL